MDGGAILKVETIDRGHRRDGTCKLCGRDATIFAVKLESGAWTEACDLCSANAREMK